jgi:hypothetical protein
MDVWKQPDFCPDFQGNVSSIHARVPIYGTDFLKHFRPSLHATIHKILMVMELIGNDEIIASLEALIER